MLNIEVVVAFELFEVIVVGNRAALEWLTVLEELDTKQVEVDPFPICVRLIPRINNRVDVATRIKNLVILCQRGLVTVNDFWALTICGFERVVTLVFVTTRLITILQSDLI
jgi:hypothetical protein